MWYADPEYPLPVEVDNSELVEHGIHYIWNEFAYPRWLFFKTKIKAIEKIEEIEKTLIYYRPVWAYVGVDRLPKRIPVVWHNGVLCDTISTKPIVGHKLFNTETEALDFAIKTPPLTRYFWNERRN